MEEPFPGTATLAATLAAALASTSDAAARSALLAQHVGVDRALLARALKDRYLAKSSSEPVQAAGAATSLSTLAEADADPEVRALALWTAGMAALQLEGQMERAVELLEGGAAVFERLGRPHEAALTQVAKVAALAILGRYEAAIACGLRARDVFVAHGDLLSAGKIEQNLGNINRRLDRYGEAERFVRAARERFIAVGDQQQLAQIENNLATVLKWQHQFRAAAELYESALARAAAAGLEVTQAEIEVNLGYLDLLQGTYGRALEHLERARRRYAALGMPHKSANAEKELANAYLELNLAPEAAELYARVAAQFSALGMRSEQAWTLAHLAHAYLLLGQQHQARTHLATAGSLYAAEGNAVGVARVRLEEAQLSLAQGDGCATMTAAAEAEATLQAAGAWSGLLLARWLRGESSRRLGDPDLAGSLLQSTLVDAADRLVPQVVLRCHTSLGLLAASAGDSAAAERAFERAVTLVEDMRAPLPAEQFRTAFLADKLVPYAELIRLCLADRPPARTAEALRYVERARSQALVEMLAGVVPSRPQPRDAYETQLLARLDRLREELNWFYGQIERSPISDAIDSPAGTATLERQIREREDAVAVTIRHVEQGGGSTGMRTLPLDVSALQRQLGRDTALVEYFCLDGELLAFVVTETDIDVVRNLCRVADVEQALGHFRSQIETMRRGAAALRRHRAQLGARTRHHLGTLYDLLLRPIEARLGDRRLVVVPYRSLHYVPFHALFTGHEYVVEQREVSYAPSATVLRHCLARPTAPRHRAVILGVPDEQAPRVREEVLALAPRFPDALSLLGGEATLAALRRAAPTADVLHLACHGQFRPDNPLFSSLRLGDGRLNVRDAYSLDLRRCRLVTLSACETGVSAVAPGDELIGLARGFFSAGASSLLVSQWRVDDDSTATLMADFYERLLAGDGPAKALGVAQRRLLAEEPHPFFWSPFVLLGRW